MIIRFVINFILKNIKILLNNYIISRFKFHVNKLYS